jgi:hypothetical protein
LMSHVGRVATSPPGSNRMHASKKDAMKMGPGPSFQGQRNASNIP